jgi:PadR family transcriptional regulator AphA
VPRSRTATTNATTNGVDVSLRAALLALISAGPSTGYDAAKRFRSTVGHLWHAPDSQIYPELRRMQADGLLEAEQVPWGKKHATKTQYTITEAGRHALAEWQRTPIDYTPERDLAHLIAAYFEWAPDTAEPRERLAEHITHFTDVLESAQQQIRGIDERSNATLSRRLESSDPSQHERIIAYKRFAYAGKIARAEAEIAWAKEGLGLLDTLEQAAPRS